MLLQNFNDNEKCFSMISSQIWDVLQRKKKQQQKINGAIPYWNTATIDWLIVFSRIRLRKARYDNPKPCWHIIGEGDSNSVYVDLIFS